MLVEHYSKKRASKTFGIQRLCQIDGGVEKKNAGCKAVLTKEQESELTSVIQEMEKILYGLTPLSVCKFVFQVL